MDVKKALEKVREIIKEQEEGWPEEQVSFLGAIGAINGSLSAAAFAKDRKEDEGFGDKAGMYDGETWQEHLLHIAAIAIMAATHEKQTLT